MEDWAEISPVAPGGGDADQVIAGGDGVFEEHGEGGSLRCKARSYASML